MIIEFLRFVCACYRACQSPSDPAVRGGAVRRKVTIDEIARTAAPRAPPSRWSCATNRGSAPRPAQRVWAAARALGYQRRPPAPVAPGQGVLNIGLIQRSRRRAADVRLPGVNAFYSWVLAGVEAAARPQRMNLLYATLRGRRRQPALSICPITCSASVSTASCSSAPSPRRRSPRSPRRGANAIVLVDAPAGSHRYDAIVSDNEAGAYHAVNHLIEHGHRRIA